MLTASYGPTLPLHSPSKWTEAWFPLLSSHLDSHKSWSATQLLSGAGLLVLPSLNSQARGQYVGTLGYVAAGRSQERAPGGSDEHLSQQSSSVVVVTVELD